MTLSFKKSLVVATAFILVSPMLFAELVTDVSIAGIFSGGDDEPTRTIISPILSIDYNSNYLSVTSENSTEFDVLEELTWTERWQSDNQIRWSTKGQRIEGNFVYLHEELKSSEVLLRSDVNQAGVSINFSAPTLKNKFATNISRQKASQEQDDSEQDVSIEGSYTLNWQPRKYQIWTFGVSGQAFRSGTDTIGVEAAGLLLGSKAEFSASINTQHVIQQQGETDVFGGHFGVSYDSGRLRSNISARREQSDSLSQFEVLFLQEDSIQQSQIILNEVSASIENPRAIGGVLVAVNAARGQIERLQSINNSGVENKQSTDYFSVGATAKMTMAHSATLVFSVEQAGQLSDFTTLGEISYIRSFNQHWSLTSRYSQARSAEIKSQWQIIVNYQL